MHRPLRTSLLVAALAGCGDGDGGSSTDGTTANDASTGAPASDTGTPTTSAGSTGDAATGSSSSPAGTDTGAPTSEGSDGTDTGAAVPGRVHVVLFTHIEDSTPGGPLGTAMSENSYLAVRAAMLDMAELCQAHGLQWVLQPDWKLLAAALLYEDADVTADTGGKNFLLYLRDDLGVVVDPHSHENGGYNYTDVAHLLDLLAVGGTTVIGGHIWDPSLPQFQAWDRFRDPVAGQMYPEASWRGDILIGAGTPMHVNDPQVSGVWRPQDRDNFFVDDPAGNIFAVGAWHDDLAGVQALVDLYADGTVPPERMLTASWNIGPTEISAPNGLADIEANTLVPLADLRDQGLVVVTDFTTLIDLWQTEYASEAFLYMP